MIILYTTFLFFVMAYWASREQSKYLLEPAQRNRRPLFTLIVDPPTFLIVGMVGTIVGMINMRVQKPTQRKILTCAVIVILSIIACAVGVWIDSYALRLAGIVGFLGTGVGSIIGPNDRKLTYKEFLTRKKIIDALLIIFVLGFWTMEALSYFNVMPHPFYPDRTGNDFMWNGYIDFLGWSVVNTAMPTYQSLGMNLLALLLLALQIPFLLLGRALGYNTAFFNDKFNWTKPKRK